MKRFGILATLVAALGALVLGTGCTGAVRDATAPSCSSRWAEPLLLVAQSVPTASRIPCIIALPLGWKVGAVEVRDGRTSFRLDTSGGPTTRLKVVLQEDCSVAGATEVATDQPGTVRYDRLPTQTGNRMVRTYTFTGGCVNYEFEMNRVTGGLVDEASLAVGFLTRAEVESRYRDQ